MDKQTRSNVPRLTTTMEAVQSELAGRKEIDAWTIVRTILNRHPEYGRHHARDMAQSTGPGSELRQTFHGWIDQVREMFDPAMVAYLHGRLVILGLCQLDEKLFAFLNSSEFLKALQD